MNQLVENKKVLMVVDAWFPLVGGGQIHVLEIAKNLAKQGFNITVLTRDLGKWSDKVEGVEFLRVGHFRDFADPLGRIEFLIISLWVALTRSYDILHLHAFSPGLLTPFVKFFRPSKKIVFTVHGKGVKVAGFNTSASFLENLVIYTMPYDVEITVAKNTLTKKTNAKEVVVIPNGVDIDKYKGAIRKRDKVKNILYVGRLSFEKGVDILIEAFKDLADKNINLVIVGTGVEESKLRENSSGISAVVFKGRLEGKDLIKEFKNADLLVLPSRTEGHPLVLFEAWASRLPIITTRVGDNEEYLRDGDNGFLCEFTAMSLKKKIKQVIRNKNLDKVAEKGYQNVSRYSWKDVAEQTAKVYKSIL